MSLTDSDIKKLSDGISNAINAGLTELNDNIERVITQQRKGIPDSVSDYRGRSFGKKIFGEELEDTLERVLKENERARKDRDYSTRFTTIFGSNKPGRELNYQKERVNNANVSYINSLKKLKGDFKLFDKSDVAVVEELEKKFKNLTEIIEQQKKSFLESIDGIDEVTTERFEALKDKIDDLDLNGIFDVDGNVIDDKKLKSIIDELNEIAGKNIFKQEDIERLYKASSSLNEKEEERKKIGSGLTRVYREQTALLEEQTRYAEQSIATMKSGISTIGSGFGKLKNLVLDFSNGWRKVDQSSANFARNIGVGSKTLNALRTNTIQSFTKRGIGLNYGISMEDFVSVQENYSKTQGRNISLSNEDMEVGAAMSRIMGSKGGEFAAALENFGLSYTEAGKRAGKMFSDASKYGLSFEKYSENFLSNIKMAQNYTFRDGLKGLERMAKESTAIKLNMQNIASFADKVGTLQGAVETSASLQVLGGPFAQFSDPLRLLSDSLTNVEGLMDTFKRMTGNIGKFNSQTGQVEITAMMRQQLKAATQAMGMNYNEVMDSVQAQGRRNFIKDKVKSSFSDEEKEFIMNTATVTGGVPQLTYFNDKGERITKDVNKLSSEEIKYARAQNQSDSDNIKSIAKSVMSFDERAKGVKETAEAIKAEFIDKGMKIANGFLSKSAEYLNVIKIAVLGIAAGKAIGGGASIVKGFAETIKGFSNFLNAGNIAKTATSVTGVGDRFASTFGTSGKFAAGLRQGYKHGRTTQTFGGVGKIGSYLGKFGKFAVGPGAVPLAAIAVSVGSIADSVIQFKKSFETTKKREELVGSGKIKKGSEKDQELTRQRWSQKGKGFGVLGGAATGVAIGSLFGPLGMVIGGAIGAFAGHHGGGAIGGALSKKEIEKRHREAINEERMRTSLKRSGFSLNGGYEEKEYLKIASIINQGGDNTITKAEFETLPEELRKKMIESGDISLFPELEEFKIQQADIDTDNATVNADSVVINGKVSSDKKAHGGLLTGPSHANGGMPIVGSNIEVEGGEFVVNKNATKEHLGLLNTINKMNDGGIIPNETKIITPLRVVPSTVNNNYSGNNIHTKIEPINVNINGTIKLDGGNGNQINMDALLKDPVFIRSITNLIEQQMIYNSKGARFTTHLVK